MDRTEVLVNNAGIHYDTWQQTQDADLTVVRNALDTKRARHLVDHAGLPAAAAPQPTRSHRQSEQRWRISEMLGYPTVAKLGCLGLSYVCSSLWS